MNPSLRQVLFDDLSAHLISCEALVTVLSVVNDPHLNRMVGRVRRAVRTARNAVQAVPAAPAAVASAPMVPHAPAVVDAVGATHVRVIAAAAAAAPIDLLAPEANAGNPARETKRRRY